MELIVISSPNMCKNEIQAINNLFENGLSILHLRKKIDLESMRDLIRKIDSQYYNRIVLHSCFELIDEFNLKGGHNKDISKIIKKEKLINQVNIRRTYSCSCHSFEECKILLPFFDYMFISPIFDSISKVGYKSNFSQDKLLEIKNTGLLSNNIYALGGIDKNNINILKKYGFKGCAVLGTLWNEFENNSDIDFVLKNFIEIKQVCSD